MKKLFDEYVNGENITFWNYLTFRKLKDELITIQPYEKIAFQDLDNASVEELTIDNYEFMGVSKLKLNYVYSIFLHGSQAHLNNIDFSDIDIVVVINDAEKFNPKLLKKDFVELRGLCKQMFKTDPLMHHGLMFMNKSDFYNYTEFFLPIDSIKNALCLYGNNLIQYRKTKKNKDERFNERLSNSLEYVQKKIHSGSIDSDYQLKNIISIILLIPSLFLSVQGIFVDKRESFDICYENYYNINWDVVKMAEKIRKNWKSPKIFILHLFTILILGGFGQKASKKFYYTNIKNNKKYLNDLKEKIDLFVDTVKKEV